MLTESVRTIAESLQAEDTLHAYDLVLDVVGAHLRGTSGTWPTSWDDLAGVRPEEDHSVFRWPQDMRKIRRRVRIDFTLSTREVARMDVAHFAAIQQIGPNFGNHEPAVRKLLHTVRQTGPRGAN
jgi:hypothetical protein